MVTRNVDYVVGMTDKMSGKLGKLNKKTNAFNTTMGKLGITIGTTFAVRGGFRFLQKTTEDFDKQAQAVAQVEAGLKSTGNTANKTLQELTANAANLQANSIFGDETILKEATAQILTFTNIANKEFDRTQQAVLDVSTRLGQDLKSTAIQLGKALNDPVANLGALSRSGIQFSKDQKAVIKSLADTNRLADAQNIILTELEKQYGGSARAARDAGLGGVKVFQNTLSDLREELGKRTVKSIRSGVNVLEQFTRSAEEFLRVPISQELRTEQVRFNLLAKDIQNANIPFERKRDLINKAQQIYPSYLKNVESEADLQKRVKEETEKANKFLEQRIKIQVQQEKISIAQRKVNMLLTDIDRFRTKAAELSTESSARQFTRITNLSLKFLNLTKDISNVFPSLNVVSNKALANINNKVRELIETKNLPEAVKKLKELEAEAGKLQQQFQKDFDLNLTPGAGGKGGIQEIKASAPKVFNINIESLVEEVSINVTNLTEGAAQTKNIVTEAMLEALNDVQTIAE